MLNEEENRKKISHFFFSESFHYWVLYGLFIWDTQTNKSGWGQIWNDSLPLYLFETMEWWIEVFLLRKLDYFQFNFINHENLSRMDINLSFEGMMMNIKCFNVGKLNFWFWIFQAGRMKVGQIKFSGSNGV